MAHARILIAVCLAPLAVLGQPPSAVRIYQQQYSPHMTPLLCEAVAFRTERGNKNAAAQQAEWLRQKARQFELLYRDAGLVTEVELPGPAGAPVLGLVVHGDVQPPGDTGWTVPPFTCTLKDGYIYGRGVADDKGPLIQAILAMAALRDSGRARTHTIRLLVGSDEESDNQDIASYLKSHSPPDVSLVLDSAFPVVVGEKAWDGLELTAAVPYRVRATGAANWRIVEIDSGVSPSIVPPSATARLEWLPDGQPGFEQAAKQLCPGKLAEGYRCVAKTGTREVILTVTGRAAHSGVNIEGGRNALVMLAHILRGKIAAGGANDLLEFVAMAGKDLYGGGLGLTRADPLWGRYNVNPGVLKEGEGGGLMLTINLRRPPPATHQEIQTYLRRVVADFNRTHKASLQMGGYFSDEPLAFEPNSKIVRRLLAAYERATGEKARPAISGGGTYAKRLPNAIAFGMWFPGKPYPGHDVDERVPVADLHRGVAVLLAALEDLASSPPLVEPFQP
jgi:predicted dipeptidase